MLKAGGRLSSAEPIPLGFEDLVVETTGRDSNTTLIYLYGFSDCMTIFEIYRLYAQKGTTVLDLGSNLAIHAMVLSRCVGETGKVIGFEAIERIYKRALYNIEANDIKNIEIRNIGVGQKVEEVCFDAHRDDCNIGKGSVSPTGDIKLQLSTVDIQCAHCEQPISLIKLDLEGYEVKALKGAQNILRQHQPVIICEYNKEHYSFEDLMNAIPYECHAYVIPYTFYEKVKLFDESKYKQGDILFVPKNKRQPPEYLGK